MQAEFKIEKRYNFKIWSFGKTICFGILNNNMSGIIKKSFLNKIVTNTQIQVLFSTSFIHNIGPNSFHFLSNFYIAKMKLVAILIIFC